jgi:hypothetical protein
MPTLHPIEISLFYLSGMVEKRLQGSTLYANPNLLLNEFMAGRIDINNNICKLEHDNHRFFLEFQWDFAWSAQTCHVSLGGPRELACLVLYFLINLIYYSKINALTKRRRFLNRPQITAKIASNTILKKLI